MKITKAQLKRLIKEELDEAGARAFGSAQLTVDTPLMISQDGRFNVDVVVEGQKTAITGQLDPDSVQELVDLVALRPVGRGL